MASSEAGCGTRLFGLHANPGLALRLLLGALPFLLLLGLYFWASDARLAANPDDKLLPGLEPLYRSLLRLATEPERRTGELLLWSDTVASLLRLGLGLGIAFAAALAVGLNMGCFKGMSVAAVPFVTFVSMIPPLALLPILFISLGVGELGKIALIVLGTLPVMTRDIAMAARDVPREQLVKALTLGASQAAVVYRVVLPQVMPRAIDTLRLNLGAAWLFLIAAEAIAATEGLGYRIFLVRRYLAMDVIIPYVGWITALGFAGDYGLRGLRAWAWPWAEGQRT